MDFVLGTTPARRIKRRRATPPNLGGKFHLDASRHSGTLIAPAGGSFACTVVNALNGYPKTVNCQMSLVRCVMHLSIVKRPIDPIPPRQLIHSSCDRAYFIESTKDVRS